MCNYYKRKYFYFRVIENLFKSELNLRRFIILYSKECRSYIVLKRWLNLWLNEIMKDLENFYRFVLSCLEVDSFFYGYKRFIKLLVLYFYIFGLKVEKGIFYFMDFFLRKSFFRSFFFFR